MNEKKIFISCDIEGTTGIAAWDETERDQRFYPQWAQQMTKEAAAACEGSLKGGAGVIFVKDAHDSARNLIPEMLPQEVRLFRGWGRTPLSMMAGIDESYAGAIFTGYHSGASMPTNPLSHTMNTKNLYIHCNGKVMPEALINAYAASYYKVPFLMITGDKGVCELMKQYAPWIETVAVSDGMGAGSVSIHPDKAVSLIREAAERAVKNCDPSKIVPLPAHFTVEICFKEHQKARWASWYPHMKQTDAYTVVFEADDYMDVLTMLHFVL